MKKEIVFYEDYFSSEQYDEIRQDIFDYNAETHNWSKPEDVPEEMIWEALNDQYREDWHYFESAMKHEFRNASYILTGTCGSWMGPADCGAFILSFQDLMKGLRHLENMKFYERNGHFYIEGSHHDGSDFYEMRRLTNKGLQLAEKYNYATDRHLHQTIMKYNFFSALPRFSKEFVAI